MHALIDALGGFLNSAARVSHRTAFKFCGHMINSALGPTQPTIQCILGDLALGIKWLGYAANQSSLSSAKDFKWKRHYTTIKMNFYIL
jgi:hypothetical protein